MTADRPSRLADTLNAALGLDLAGFTEARVFLRSPEGDTMLEAWLATQRAADSGDDDE
jgi:hypothetical protein